MKKTLIYMLILIALGAGVWYFVFRDKDAFSKSETGFRVDDTASVYKIFLADKKGKQILLERKDGGWVLNNQYPAMQAPVNVLLSTVKRQVAQYPVPQNAYDNIIKMMAGEAVKVELYDKSGDKITVFYVVGEANKNAGSYMLMEGSEMPYVVQIPGFEGYLAGRYSTALEDWRDRTVFDVPESELKSVSVTYSEEPLNSFTLRRLAADNIEVDVDKALMTGRPLNKRRAGVYSRFFAKVYSEGYINGALHMDSILKSVPKYCGIDVTAINGKTAHADVYWMPLNKRSKNMLTPFPGIDNRFDADRFYAVINNFKDTVIIQRFTFDKIFRKAYEFYEADDTTGARETIEIPKGGGNVYRVGGSGK
ncbi:MAG: DUF4340 domain-containing protein [Flavipsychrobacter sp.]